MAGTKEIKRRIKSVKNTKKITKAMELVAASKMKRAVASTLASRSYSDYSWQILNSISDRLENLDQSFFTEQKEGRTLVVLVSSNRGLCGGYNSQVMKKIIQKMKEMPSLELIDIITIGKKGDTALRRLGQNITAVFNEMPELITFANTISISQLILNEFKILKDSGEKKFRLYKDIFVVYTDFISALNQRPTIKKLLPILNGQIEEKDTVIKEGKVKLPYLVEGDQNELVQSLAEKIISMQIYQMILESGASEQSARMVAMKNANEASGEMISDLTLLFNKARQSNITREISEISAGMASVS